MYLFAHGDEVHAEEAVTGNSPLLILAAVGVVIALLVGIALVTYRGRKPKQPNDTDAAV